ncbi:hypothetical protein YQE_11739, partial [Dendroctonus ponderosae]
MWRLRPGNLALRFGEKSARQSIPPQLFHLSSMSKTALDRRRTLRIGRQQIYMQRRLSERK